jgi:nucleoside-diphosphate-sugar epimerase
MSNNKLDKIKSNTPVSLILHGGNRQGFLLAKTLIDQGSYVIIVDRYNNATQSYIKDLKKTGQADFFDFKGLASLYKKLKRFDYIFYQLNKKLIKSNFDSKEFLEETNFLDTSLKIAKKHNAKVCITTSLALNRELSTRINSEEISKPSAYSNVELQKYCETLATEFQQKTNANIRILRIATTIGSGIERIENDIVHNLILEATQKSQLTIHGEGLEVHNLINEDDATYGILKLTFADRTKGEVITLANKNDYTTLSVAYKLLELNTEAQSIKFVEDSDSKFIIRDLYVPATHASKYGWSQQFTLEDSLIEQIHTYYDKANKKWNFGEEAPKRAPVKNIKKDNTKLGEFLISLKKPFEKILSKTSQRKDLEPDQIVKIGAGVITGILAIYFLIYPIIGIGIGSLIISRNLDKAKDAVIELDISQANDRISKIDKNIDKISKGLDNLYWAFKITGQKEFYENTTEILLGFQYATEGADSLVDGVSPLLMYIKDFEPSISLDTSTPTTTREYRSYLESMEENHYKIEDASYKISLASEIITNVQTTEFPKILQDPILSIKDLIAEVNTVTGSIEEVSTFIPDLLGVEERKRYLILLQNESEIRSTGGWLTSYGIVGIEGGQVREMFVDDIYNADGSLKAQNKTYTPPSSMENALEVSTWPFSLINWYPDLTETYIAAEPFIKELGKGNDLDGVITIDVGFIQKILSAWGGIEVPGENEIITSDNLYSKIFEMHEDFTPGSTQKTTFMANLANEIVTKILSMNIPELAELGDVFTAALNEKHLQATFKNRSAYQYFNNNSWAGSIDSKYTEAPVVIDWNWGGNKANLYLEKNHNLEVDIKDSDTIDFTYSLSVENTSTENEYPQGDYINYQRIYIPANAEIISIKGIEENEYDIYKESGFKVIGGWFNTEINSTNTLEVSYRLSRSKIGETFPLVSENGNMFLDLNIFKQAGESRHAYKLDVIYPSTWNLQSAESLNSISNQLSSRFDLDTEKEFNINWYIPN